jgi:thiamine biosynthesis lipoprotein
MYRVAYRLWERSGGALDFGAAALYDAWGFGFRNSTFPTDEEVARLLEQCGMGHLPAELPVTDGYIDPAVMGYPRLNYNAIAQGYSCDKVAEYLYSIGVKDMLVDIGEIFCDGHNPAGKPWRVGVDRPKDGNNSPGTDMDGIWESDGSARGIVTSGNYRKFYIKDGVKYSHTIDPRTGYPVQHNLLSATILAPTAMAADAYATYCMVAGYETGRDFILSRPDLEGYLICAAASVTESESGMTEWASPGFKLTQN